MTPEEEFAEFDRLGEAKVSNYLANEYWQGTQANKAKAWLELRASARADRAALIVISCIAAAAFVAAVIAGMSAK